MTEAVNFMQEQFQYVSSPHIAGVSYLSARMQEFTYSMHAHEEYSIGITLKGQQDFFSNGIYHKSQAGNVIFFNPEQPHDGCSGSETGLEYNMLYIPADTLTNLMLTFGQISQNKARLKSSMFQDDLLSLNLIGLFYNIQQPLSNLEEEAILLTMAQSVLRLGGGTPYAKRDLSRKDSLLLRAQDYILSNLEQKFSIDDISQAVNISKYHFIRLFNEQYGMTPHQYVINCRINRAKNQLENGDKASDIALDLGFADINHFNRQFRRVFGITPHQYQIQIFN